MNKLQGKKFDKFFVNQEQTMKEIAQAISKLHAHVPAAIKHQAYALSNVDDNMDDSIKDSISRRVTALGAQFVEVVEMINDIVAVKDSLMTVDQLIAEYDVNLVTYSNDLE